LLLGERLLEKKISIGRNLIANGFIHDNSKFYGVEWDHLTSGTDDPDLMRVAIKHHNTTNPHHPEYWGTIDKMPQLYLAEAVCDWLARASEFGTSLQDWIEEGAAKRFDYELNSTVHKDIMFYTNLLCDKPFKAI
jgi:hypothetical protein